MTDKLTLEIAADDFWKDPDQVLYPVLPEKHHRVRCLCGRFGKWGGDQHYYNGNFNCYRFTVICSQCGEVDVECV